AASIARIRYNAHSPPTSHQPWPNTPNNSATTTRKTASSVDYRTANTNLSHPERPAQYKSPHTSRHVQAPSLAYPWHRNPHSSFASQTHYHAGTPPSYGQVRKRTHCDWPTA